MLIPVLSLFLLGTTTARLLSSLDGLLVTLGRTLLHGAHEPSSLLEGTLEVANGRLAVDVDLDEVALEGALDGEDALDEKRVGVLHVEVHDGHDGNAHHLTAEESAELVLVVGLDGGGDELAFFGGAHWRGLDVLEGGEVYWGVEKLVLLRALGVWWRVGLVNLPFFLLI